MSRFARSAWLKTCIVLIILLGLGGCDRDGGSAGSESAGSEATGSEAVGSEAAGSEPAGSEPAGSEPAGSEPAGSQSEGRSAGEICDDAIALLGDKVASSRQECEEALSGLRDSLGDERWQRFDACASKATGRSDFRTCLVDSQDRVSEAYERVFDALSLASDDERLVEMLEEIADVIKVNKDDCDKMASALESWWDDNGADVKSVNKSSEVVSAEYEGRIANATEKMMGGVIRCTENKRFQEVFGVITDQMQRLQ